MKLLILITAIVFGFVQSIPESEKFGNIWAPSGLALRFQPFLDSEISWIIQFGERIEILECLNTPMEILATKRVNNREGYKLNGSWLKINYKGKIGFIYSGWISKMTKPINDDLLGFMEQQYGVSVKDIKETKSHKLEFSNKSSYEQYNPEGCAVMDKFKLLGLNLNDGFLICYNLLNIDNSSKSNLNRQWCSEDEYYELVSQSSTEFVFRNWINTITCSKIKDGIIIEITNS